MCRRGFTIMEVMVAVLILAIGIASVLNSVFSINAATRASNEDRRAQEIAQILIERIQGEAWQRIGKRPWSWHRREDAESLTSMMYCDQLGAESPLEFKHRPLIDEPTMAGGVAVPQLYDYLRSINNKIGGGVADLSDFEKDGYGLPWVCDKQIYEFGQADNDAIKPATFTVPAELVTKYNVPERYNWLQFVGLLDKPSGLENLKVYLEYYRQDTLTGVASRKDWMTNRQDAANRYQQSHVLFDLAEQGTTLDRDAILGVVIITWNRHSGGVGRHEVMMARRQ